MQNFLEKRHLSLSERQFIEHSLQFRRKITAIAKMLKRDHSVISRETSRNLHPSGVYSAQYAHDLFTKRQNKRLGRKLEKDLVLCDYVKSQIKKGLAPHVIAGRLKNQHSLVIKDFPALRNKIISHEAIYDYIYNGRGRFEELYYHLPYKRSKRQKRKYRKKRNKINIPDRVTIHARPDEINFNLTFGNWETDSLVNGRQKQALSSQYERKAKLLRLHKTTNRTAEQTENAIRKTIDSLPLYMFKTFTYDNGTEGVNHTKIRDDFDVKNYFCDTYSAWQKGGVENVNGIIRRYIPKTKDLSTISDEEIYEIQETINNTPRKSLGYLSPNEVVYQHLGVFRAL